MMFIVRHTNAYPYSNIWLNVYYKEPGDSSFTRTRVEIPLAEPSGKWLGRGMGEIYEQRMFIDQLHLDRVGKYEMRLEQNMRVNELPEILQVGLRLEKTPHVKRG
jgi:gliding motility-associated lipoprotein GldH